MNESEKIIKDFLQEIAAQDNRGTAAPYFYVIRTAEYVAAYHEGEGDRDSYVNNDDYEDVFYVYPDLTKLMIRDEVSAFRQHKKDCEEFENMTDEDIEAHIEQNYTLYSEKNVWREECMFLTEKDAQYHLEANKHHYSADAHTYVKHCWRAPDLEKFFIALFQYFNVDKGKLDLKMQETQR